MVVVPDGFPVALEAVAEFCRALGIKLLVLFGSRATGRGRPDSDWDLALLVGPGVKPQDVAFRLWQALSERARTVEWDVTPLNNASSIFQGLVATRGRPLYQGRGSDWAEFVSLALRRYEDDAKWRRAQRQYVERWCAEVARRGA